MRYNNESAVTAVGGLGCLIFLGYAVFWIGVICVAWHFISKLW